MKKLVTAFSFMLLISTGCIESIHSIVTDDTAYVVDGLDGTWTASVIPKASLFDNGTLYIDDKVSDSSDSILEDVKNHKGQKGDENLGVFGLADKLTETSNNSNSITGFEIGSFKIERAHILYFDRPGKSTVKIGKMNFTQIDGTETLHGYPLSTYKDSSHIILKDNSELPYYIMHEFNRDHDPCNNIYGKGIKQKKTIKFTKIGSNLFMDVTNRLSGMQTKLVGHTFYKVKLSGDEMLLYRFNQEYLKEQIKSKKIRIKHEKTFKDNIVITASTQEMRSFLDKYGDSDKIFQESVVYKRIPEENIF